MGLHDPQAPAGPRVTDTRRYFALHEAAEKMLTELADTYVVEWRESKEPLDGDVEGPLLRIVRLIPHSLAAAPLAVVFTDFPSVISSPCRPAAATTATRTRPRWWPTCGRRCPR